MEKFKLIQITKLKTKFSLDEHGQSLVEFALVIPIFIWLFMGMIDFGWYIKLNHDLTRANSQGARVAAFSGSNEDIIQAVMESSSSYLPISSSNVGILREDVQMTRGTNVDVESNSTYSSITGFSPVHYLLNQNPLHATARIRIE